MEYQANLQSFNNIVDIFRMQGDEVFCNIKKNQHQINPYLQLNKLYSKIEIKEGQYSDFMQVEVNNNDKLTVSMLKYIIEILLSNIYDGLIYYIDQINYILKKKNIPLSIVYDDQYYDIVDSLNFKIN